MDERVLKLLSNLSSATDIVRAHDNVHIFSHHDADGISAAIILARTMIRAGKGFKLTLLSALNDETIEEIKKCGAGCVIVADMGASYLDSLDGMNADVVVLDHHKGDGDVKRVHYANPHSFGIDGQDGGCGASIAMLFSIKFDKENWDLVQIAFAGIVGDKQHLKGLTGINEYLLAEGRKRGYVTCAEGSLIPRGELMSALYRTTEPYIRGVSGNADGVAKLLNDAGIDRTRSSSDLNDAEKRKLSSLIAAKLLAQNVTSDVMNEVSMVRYVLKDWKIDAEEFASLLNSCGRSGSGSIGIGLGLGDRKCMNDAASKDGEVKEMIAPLARDIDSKGLEQMKNIQFFSNDASGFTGTLCEVMMRFAADQNKPTIGYNTSNGMVKVSGRCTHAILRKGVDLSTAMREAGKQIGGGGGGHMIASGAWFPSGREKKFLETLDKIIGEQLIAK